MVAVPLHMQTVMVVAELVDTLVVAVASGMVVVLQVVVVALQVDSMVLGLCKGALERAVHLLPAQLAALMAAEEEDVLMQVAVVGLQVMVQVVGTGKA